MTSKVTIAAGCLLLAAHASAQENPQDRVRTAPNQLTLLATRDAPGDACRMVEKIEPADLVPVSLHRTFHDDFDQHPLSSGKWEPHYAGGAAWPEARYWGGENSDVKRKDAWNGEQQIYVDPRYAGRAAIPLGLDPFKINDGVLSIVASRIPPALKAVLFDNEYTSGILTSQSSFAQKYGYFEIRAKIPAGIGVWPAFWLLANDGGWPPEIDILEGRGQHPGDIVMTTHWRIPSTQKIEHCGFDFLLPDAPTGFHDYGMLWERDRLVYFIDRKPVSDIKAPVGFDDPMYMIVNLAMGAKYFGGVGIVDGMSPDTVAFEIDRISVYQIDPYQQIQRAQNSEKTEMVGQANAR
ncbi:glycoside hydrolase family 16 protein [Bradyrhizobium sp.]|uniref:glycoside hydrolase family 16 protein n=1 Tax=Bradyrhizobium sp. TaxID=376 RepID=UPI0025C50169|nr:glycoside hydrolase family 16 protein [Bradyrhizobium sp.]